MANAAMGLVFAQATMKALHVKKVQKTLKSRKMLE